MLSMAVVAAVLFLYPGPAALYDILAAPLVAHLPKGATLIATSVISLTFITSWQSTGLTPQTSASRRAVVRLGVMPMIGARGRSRAMRSADEPELV